MKETHSNKTESLWHKSAHQPRSQQALQTDLTTDVCIVGAGISGLMTAYLLAKEGVSCVLLEAKEMGSGETLRTTAHLSNALDEGYVYLENKHGLEGAQAAAQSHKAAMQKVAEVSDQLGADWNLRWLNGYLFKGRKVTQKELRQEFEASQRAGISDCSTLPRVPWDFYDTGPCICYPSQLTLNPSALMETLQKELTQLGVRIFTRSPVMKVENGSSCTVTTEQKHKVRAGQVVIATNTPIHGKVLVHTRQAAYRTYAVGAKIPKGSVPDGLYWDMEDPYHYVRLATFDELHDVLIVGGEDHKTGEDSKEASEFQNLKEWTRQRFPMASEYVAQWSGQVMEPMDGLALLGRHDSDNTYIITGDSGHGFTHGVLGAMIVSDLIGGKKNPWEDLYNPSRFTLKASPTFLKENMKVLGHYAEWLKKEKSAELEALSPGSGLLLQKGFKKVAVAKDQDGTVHSKSATCTHMGCLVSWNSVEKSWDCPCHGSRFSLTGEVLNGPAVKDLAD